MSACIAVPLADTVLRGLDLELWRVDLDASQEPPGEAVADLDADERKRLAGFRQVGDRARFACLRAALRRLLGARCGIAARAVPIRIDPHGKPRLPGDALWFSLAHSGNHGLLAISATAPVGVDVEEDRPFDRIEAVADLILSAGERPVWTRERPDLRQALLLRLWTAKEAVLKAAGTGLLTDPRSVTVLDEAGTLALRRLPTHLGFDPTAVVVATLPVIAGYTAALAMFK